MFVKVILALLCFGHFLFIFLFISQLPCRVERMKEEITEEGTVNCQCLVVSVHNNH